ncbi:LPXTG cell wall anchor domain-containing protein [Actinoplanes sp. CA-142083]|uniref:LPXTG cell wall anchor domain-containing protein n=1 Tax=Actinoplanes sp. CA-142083 TaxID=3239903 RepID=UPI003D92AD77
MLAFVLFAALITVSSSTAPSIKPGQTIPLTVGVRNTGGSAVDGVVVNIRVSGGLTLPREFTNCRYYKDGILAGAWCSLPQRVDAGATYALSGFHIAASATAQRVSPVVFEWHPKSSAPAQIGTAGSGSTLALTPAKLSGAAVGAVYLRLLTSTATPRPSRSALAASPASRRATPESTKSAAAAETGKSGGTNLLLLVGGLVLLVAFFFLVRRRSGYVGKHNGPRT